jgi:hypothetical protein
VNDAPVIVPVLTLAFLEIGLLRSPIACRSLIQAMPGQFLSINTSQP